MPLTPIEIKIYSALVSQTGTNAPTAVILQNTLNLQITWRRDGQGQYMATMNKELEQDKVQLLHSNNSGAVANQSFRFYSATEIIIEQINVTNNLYIDGIDSMPFEIRLYHTKPLTIIQTD